ncbi:protein-tyrosine phosphatase-like protein [Pseudoneurospora amorphoporcata]|uniref:Protein-tyrosine phosphatase-like protein n=1 Tax=Pseudoneurospora amorphoporcata TaxID=241081 RepID=A0AAN6P1W7_9PEZI|nr:protein-tyrosine phosphatase-like protein [Pseudoneurospora amorphoporcata]
MALPTLSKADLIALSETDVTQPIPKESIFAALATPPFLYIPGTFNTRDLGLLPLTTTPPSNNPNGQSRRKVGIRPGLIYRSGGFFPNGGFNDAAKTQLATQLGIKKIFDIRSVREHSHAPDPEIPGVKNIWIGAEATEKEATVNLADFLEGKGEQGYVKMYMDVLAGYKDVIGALLRSILETPEEPQPILFHCTAGRDRTGVVAGLLLSLAGVSEEDVEMDWMLSRIGTEMAREQLLGFAMKGAGVNSMESAGFGNLVSLRRECWAAFVREVKRVYGGWEGYVRGELGLGVGEVERIGKVLRGE